MARHSAQSRAPRAARLLLFALAIGTAGWTAMPQAARAEHLPGYATLWYASSVVPIDGLLLLRWECHYRELEGCPVEDLLEGFEVRGVVDGTPIAGRVVRQGYDGQANSWFMMWRPDEPFEVEGRYVVESRRSALGAEAEKYALRAVYEVSFEPVAPTVRLVTATNWTGPDVACCATANGQECFGRRQIVEPFLTLDFGLDGAGSDQWLYATSFYDTAGERWRSQPKPADADGNLFHRDAEAYCFDTKAEHAVTGRVERFSGCVRNDLDGLGTRDAAPPLPEQIALCVEPPLGFEHAWCAARASTAGTAASVCAPTRAHTL